MLNNKEASCMAMCLAVDSKCRGNGGPLGNIDVFQRTQRVLNQIFRIRKLQ